jgi:hypothetical protein
MTVKISQKSGKIVIYGDIFKENEKNEENEELIFKHGVGSDDKHDRFIDERMFC